MSRPLKHLTLRFTVFSILAMFALASLANTFLLELPSLEKNYETKAYEQLKQMLNLTQSMVEYHLRSENLNKVKNEVSIIASRKDVKRVVLFNEKMEPVASNNYSMLYSFDKKMINATQWSIIKESLQKMHSVVKNSNQPYLLTGAVPVVIGGSGKSLRADKIGALLISLDYSSGLMKSRDLFYRQQVVQMSILLFISFIIAYLFYTLINRPVEQLKEAALKFSGGDYKVRYQGKAPGELGVLAESFNTMAENIEQSSNEVQKEKVKFQQLLKNAIDGVHITTLEADMVECSDSFAKMLGYTKEEALNLNAKDWSVKFLEGEDHLNDILREKEKRFETKFKRKDGTLFDVDVLVKIIELDNIKYLYASARDITVQKGKERLIEEQKNELETIFNNAQDAIAIIDFEGRFLVFNKAFMNLTKYSEDVLLTKKCSDLTVAEDREKNQKTIERAIKSRKVEFVEKSCMDSRGSRLMVTMSVALLPDKERLLLILHDMTKAKLLQEQSKLAAMGEMIGNIAHQWRQPLNVISTGATGLKIQKEYNNLTDEVFFKTCDAINDNAQYLSKTIDDFRDFIKGERKLVKFNLTDDINSFLHLVEGSIKNNDIRLITLMEEDINFKGYPNELIQCFINIFNNSKDALKAIEGERYIFISTALKGDKAVISFKDNAGGIPEDVMPHIFEPYFTTKHKSKGTGLGLSMSYTLITEGMNGNIDAHNVTYEYEGKTYNGAVFAITLPLS